MQYKYSSRHYLIGFILFFFVSMSGAFALTEALVLFPVIYFAYMGVCCVMLYGYWEAYYHYKGRSILLHRKGIIISDRKKVVTIRIEEIDCFIAARHRQRLKIHDVVHVFLLDGRYLYFTSDIARYEFFKKDLNYLYGRKYHVRTRLFSEDLPLTKENLLNEEE